jgi:hypothetical protein
MLGGSIHNIKENAEALVVASKEIGLEVHADKYMVMSRDQNARRSHNKYFDSRSYERVEEFKYLGTTLINKYSIQEESDKRLKEGNYCFHSVQYLLSYSLLTKKYKDTQNYNFACYFACV